MVNLKFFVIKERLSTFWAVALLPPGKLLFGERQVAGFRRLSLLPVVRQGRVIGG